MAASMDPLKNRGRRKIKFFACFNPVADDDDPGSCLPPPPSEDDDGVRRRNTAHLSLSGSLKAVFFQAPLVKKLRSKRYRRDSSRSVSSSSSKIKKLINPTKKKPSSRGSLSGPEESFRASSGRSSLFSSASCSSASSISSNRNSCPERAKEPASLDQKLAAKRVGGKSGNNPVAGMCILLVCLVALVFWGKAFAIVTCTSTWLFFAPCSGPDQGPGPGPQANCIVDSEEYKKRVIMEGLLERNRSRVL